MPMSRSKATTTSRPEGKKPRKAAKKAATANRRRGPGRPSKKSPELIEAICARLTRGEPLAVICRDEGMPDPATIWRWVQADESISQAIAHARELGEDAIAADCLLIADDASGDYRMGEKSILVDQDHIQRAKLRIETRLKLLAKWNPKRWGEKLQQEIVGKDGGPVQTETAVKVVVVPQKQPAEVATAPLRRDEEAE